VGSGVKIGVGVWLWHSVMLPFIGFLIIMALVVLFVLAGNSSGESVV